jgi:CRP-like cAMP-binding protein
MISLFVTTGDGEMIETGTIGREGAAGLQSGFGLRKSYGLTTIQIAGDFATIAATRFEHTVSKSAAIRDLVFHYTEVLWAEAQQIAACNAAHSGSARLCRRLLQVADCIGSDHIPLTHEYLATMIGVRRTTVTLLALELQDLGAIKGKRRKIAILDRRALEARACECYQSMTQHNLMLKMGLTF